jgi:hypothetical protein
MYLLINLVLASDHHSTMLKIAFEEKNPVGIANEINLTKISAEQFLNIVEKEKENTTDAVYKTALEKQLRVLKASILLLM